MKIDIVSWRDKTDRSFTNWRASCIPPVPITEVYENKVESIASIPLVAEGKDRESAEIALLARLHDYLISRGVAELERNTVVLKV